MLVDEEDGTEDSLLKRRHGSGLALVANLDKILFKGKAVSIQAP